MAATALEQKGLTRYGVKFFAVFIQQTGVRRFVNESDGEPALKALKDAAAKTPGGVVGRHPRTADREETLRVLMRKTKISGHSNVDSDIADYDDHYLESLFSGRTKSGIIYLEPDEMASEHKILVNLKIGPKNTRIGVPRELEGWMKTTLYRDNTTLRWILFEDRVAPRHHRQLLDGVDWCVCMLQLARTTVDGVSYMASCRTAMSRGQRRVFESHARQIEQDDRFVSGVLTAQSCENLLHYGVEPNAYSDIMIVSDIDLPSKRSSKYIVTSHSLQPESSAQSTPTSDSILCTAHALLETCCHMKAKLLILTIAYPGVWEVVFHVEQCNVLHTLAEHGIDILYITRLAECRHNTICLLIFTIRSFVMTERFTRRLHESYSARWTGDAIASGFLLLLLFLMWEFPVTGMLSCQSLFK